MTPLQEKELEMLKIFIRLCDQLGLCYYLVCGSALGAVKYGGFIPWDDDVDVALPRADYEVFLSKAPQLLPEGFFLQNYRTDPAFPQIFSKLRNSNTAFIEKSAAGLPINHGIYIDIFPLDGYPQGRWAQWLLEVKKRLYLQALGSAFAAPETPLRRILWRTKRLLGFHRRTAGIARRYEALLMQYPPETSLLWCNHGNWQGRREYAPKAQYGSGISGSFEGQPVRLPSRYHDYLTQKYADYRRELPRHQQVGHHFVTVCDCSRPYTDYISEGNEI